MNLEQRKANMVYEIASLINDDPLSAPVLIEELVEVMFDEQIDQIEDVIVNSKNKSKRDTPTLIVYQRAKILMTMVAKLMHL